MRKLRDYTTRDGVAVAREWLKALRDKTSLARIQMRLDRLVRGSFGDCKPLRDGVWELRIDSGPGYRVYYAVLDNVVILLLCGGDKRKQDSDIDRAVAYLNDYMERTK